MLRLCLNRVLLTLSSRFGTVPELVQSLEPPMHGTDRKGGGVGNQEGLSYGGMPVRRGIHAETAADAL